MDIRNKLLAASVALTSGAAFATEVPDADKVKPLDIIANVDISGVTAMQDKVVLVMVGVAITGLVYHIFKRYAR